MCDVIHDPTMDKCRQLLIDEIEHCKADLAPLEGGQVRAGESFKGSEWHDVTPALIAAHKRSLGALEVILETIR